MEAPAWTRRTLTRSTTNNPRSSSDKKLVFLLISTGNIICEICNNHGTVQLSSSSSSSSQHRKSRMICDATTSTTALLRMSLGMGVGGRDDVQAAAGRKWAQVRVTKEIKGGPAWTLATDALPETCTYLYLSAAFFFAFFSLLSLSFRTVCWTWRADAPQTFRRSKCLVHFSRS